MVKSNINRTRCDDLCCFGSLSNDDPVFAGLDVAGSSIGILADINATPPFGIRQLHHVNGGDLAAICIGQASLMVWQWRFLVWQLVEVMRFYDTGFSFHGLRFQRVFH